MIAKDFLSKSIKLFISSATGSSLLLLLCTAISLVISNTAYGIQYIQFFKTPLLDHQTLTPTFIINDVLMSFFFLLVGLEIKRSMVEGELATFKKASLPAIAAFGGMIVPACFFVMVNYQTAFIDGWAIPVATDIAFAVAVLTLLGNKIPNALKVFLIAVAVVDDIEAIVIIACFYTDSLDSLMLLMALAVFMVLLFANKKKVESVFFYLVGGMFLWYFIHASGIHATISGVLLALTIPFKKDEESDTLQKLEHSLNKPVNLMIMPLFALCNTGIIISSDSFMNLSNSLSKGIFLGLLLGKPIGISLFAWLAIKSKISERPHKVSSSQIIGTAMLGGIGFTMSIFITILAFKDHHLQDISKMSILLASAVAGLVGYFILFASSKTSES
jgi:Na+:H+ antiporter, NhaA family